jgi:hypothetical protein
MFMKWPLTRTRVSGYKPLAAGQELPDFSSSSTNFQIHMRLVFMR